MISLFGIIKLLNSKAAPHNCAILAMNVNLHCGIFYAPGSNDQGHIVFVLSVCCCQL